jgi:hypothetical protein
MGGRRNTMVWAAFVLADLCLFVSKNGKPIATFSEWTLFVIPLVGLLVAGIVTEEKFKGDTAVEMTKMTGVDKTVNVSDVKS